MRRMQMGLLDIFRINAIKAELEKTKLDCQQAENLLKQLDGYSYNEIQTKIKVLNENYQQDYVKINSNIELLHSSLVALESNIEEAQSKLDKTIKSTNTQSNKLMRSKELVKAINYTLENYIEYEPSLDVLKLHHLNIEEIDTISPSISLHLHCMDVKELRKAYKENDKLITSLLEKYSKRYTTKSNKAIYNLMVIALRAELQNILINLKYEKLDVATSQVKEVTQKYLAIAGDGNQSILSTLTKFIGEIEYLFINAVEIEYNYYVKKEQARQEQLEIRAQMKQEAEERKALAAEKAKIEKEESKYNDEIVKLKSLIPDNPTDEEAEKYRQRILELEEKLVQVALKKDDITRLANGKAGNVYIISNLGSFGENVFKIGMTRRLDPQDRVNELGDASVPFKFDVHSFIFSEDAVALEHKLHQIMVDKRVNKVNSRREFFYTNVDELEELVNSIEPTAEFNKTMIAEEFNQSLSM